MLSCPIVLRPKRAFSSFFSYYLFDFFSVITFFCCFDTFLDLISRPFLLLKQVFFLCPLSVLVLISYHHRRTRIYQKRKQELFVSASRQRNKFFLLPLSHVFRFPKFRNKKPFFLIRRSKSARRIEFDRSPLFPPFLCVITRTIYQNSTRNHLPDCFFSLFFDRCHAQAALPFSPSLFSILFFFVISVASTSISSIITDCPAKFRSRRFTIYVFFLSFTVILEEYVHAHPSKQKKIVFLRFFYLKSTRTAVIFPRDPLSITDKSTHCYSLPSSSVFFPLILLQILPTY